MKRLLTDLSIDVQTRICEYLNPSQILVLRKTSKAFYETTSLRIVWVHALQRICHQHFLFLPSFPIDDMSVADLERAATSPSRWNALSSSEELNKDGLLPPRMTRVIQAPVQKKRKKTRKTRTAKNIEQSTPSSFFATQLMPGGRYLVTGGVLDGSPSNLLSVWDLGCVSDTKASSIKQPTMWSAEAQFDNCLVHPTPDGLGLRILTYAYDDTMIVYEIYPQREDAGLEEIANLTALKFQFEETASIERWLCGNKVVTYAHQFNDATNGIVAIWDFVANTGASWSVKEPGSKSELVHITDTSIVIFHNRSKHLWIYKIPPLIEISLLHIEDSPPFVDPILTFEYPKNTSNWCQVPDGAFTSNITDLPLYIDSLQNGKFARRKLEIASDFSKLSVTPIGSLSIPPKIYERKKCSSISYHTCEDKLVNSFAGSSPLVDVWAPTLLTATMEIIPPSDLDDSISTPIINVNTSYLAYPKGPYGFCAATGRIVYAKFRDLVVLDFL